jgi:hypothetical protein
MPKKKIKITVFCRDKEVYLEGDREFGYLADTILEHEGVQRACLTKSEKERVDREERRRGY